MDTGKRNITVAITVAMFLGAVEGTVVTTAVPTIVKDLSGFELISWVFSIYLLTSAVSIPICGKLSDLYGRKNVLNVGILIFLAGSTMCGLSASMYGLIAFRALQGIGAGAIFTVTFTIVGDVFELEERAKVQGWMNSTWGVASLVGPFVGGFLIDNLSWHWIFFINIPFGILSIILLQRNLKEGFARERHRVDAAGVVLLSAGIIALLYGFLMFGENDFATLAALLISAGFLAAFYFVEKKAGEPIVPFDVFTKTNTIVNMVSFLASAVLIAINVYMPLYIQNVLGLSATVSGLTMAPMSVTWLLASVYVGKAIPRFGEKAVIAVSSLVIAASCLLLPTLGLNSPLFLVTVYTSVMGFGFGAAFTTLTIVVQMSVDYNKRGAATASNSLVRTLGQTIGISIFGSVFNLAIVKYLTGVGIQGVDAGNLYSTTDINNAAYLEQARSSQVSGLHFIYTAIILIALAGLVLSLVLPKTQSPEPE